MNLPDFVLPIVVGISSLLASVFSFWFGSRALFDKDLARDMRRTAARRTDAELAALQAHAMSVVVDLSREAAAERQANRERADTSAEVRDELTRIGSSIETVRRENKQAAAAAEAVASSRHRSSIRWTVLVGLLCLIAGALVSWGIFLLSQ